jgi:hypothetical protein
MSVNVSSVTAGMKPYKETRFDRATRIVGIVGFTLLMVFLLAEGIIWFVVTRTPK